MQSSLKPVTVVIRLRARPRQADALEQNLVALKERVATEPFYRGVQINRDDHQFLMYERWQSEAYFRGEHQETAHLQAFMAELPSLIAEPLKISFLQLVNGYGEFSE